MNTSGMGALLEEWEYRYAERLGILCGSKAPEPWMLEMAEKEADRAIEEIMAWRKSVTWRGHRAGAKL